MWEEFDKWSERNNDDNFDEFIKDRIKNHYEYISSDEIRDLQEKYFLQTLETYFTSEFLLEKNYILITVKLPIEGENLILSIKATSHDDELEYSIIEVRESKE